MASSYSKVLSRIRAKSATAGGVKTTLEGHTSAVVARLAQRRDRCPHLDSIVECPNLWARAFWGAVLHDFGKACRGFQYQLQPGAPPWGRRHEVASLAFVNWVVADNDVERAWLTACIASHHRDIDEILEYIPKHEDDDVLAEMLAEIDSDVVEALGDLLLERPLQWAKRFGFSRVQVPRAVPPSGSRADWLRKNGRPSVIMALQSWKRLNRRLQDEPSTSPDNRTAIAIRGLIMLADHTASAAAHVAPAPVSSPMGLLRTLCLESPYEHQNRAAEVEGNALLVAPTGSGKTESALLWAARQSLSTPIVYVLPYQASLNAMQTRLERTLGSGAVTLEHAKAASVLYAQALDKGYSPAAAAADVRRQKALARLHASSARVTTPYQLLKAAFQLRGFEAGWTALSGARLVFDEIHAYDAQRLSLILATLNYAVSAFGATAFVMSATLPSLLHDRITATLGHVIDIRASDETFLAFRRHVLRTLPGGVFDRPCLDSIRERMRNGQAVLLVTNTVGRARQAAQVLSEFEPLVLHSRFVGRDRRNKEVLLQRLMGTKCRDVCAGVLCIATQIVEVSLDVDFDVLFTEPAPLEALIQRFGRVNRGRRHPTCDVIVLREPESETAPYSDDWVRAALEVVTGAADKVVDEGRIACWLDTVYSGPRAEKLQADIVASESEAWRSVLGPLHAFQSNDELARAFDDLFDGYEVVPASLEREALELVRREPLRLPEVLVPISSSLRARLKREGRLRFASIRKGGYLEIADVEYDSISGLGG